MSHSTPSEQFTPSLWDDNHENRRTRQSIGRTKLLKDLQTARPHHVIITTKVQLDITTCAVDQLIDVSPIF
jgi:hypothetical protein